MKATRSNSDGRDERRRDAAFTLVELLIVIAIIILLITIIMPSLLKAMTFAKQGRTTALIRALDIGLEMFNTDTSGVVAGYPPSFWDANDPMHVTNPYAASNATHIRDPRGSELYYAYGAQVLLWGLAGPDMLGCAGFDPAQRELHEVCDYGPAYPRAGPFVDIVKLNIKTPVVGKDIFPTRWNLAMPMIPVIMDDFNNPVLYYRADRSEPGMDRYESRDNAPFLNWDDDAATGDWLAADREYTYRDNRKFKGFNGFIHNPTVAAMDKPHNPDTYLLITAGPDELYGTADDIANFPVTQSNMPKEF